MVAEIFPFPYFEVIFHCRSSSIGRSSSILKGNDVVFHNSSSYVTMRLNTEGQLPGLPRSAFFKVGGRVAGWLAGWMVVSDYTATCVLSFKL